MNNPRENPRIYTPPVFLPAEVRARVESLLPHADELTRSEVFFLRHAISKLDTGGCLDRGELRRLNSDRLREFVLRSCARRDSAAHGPESYFTLDSSGVCGGAMVDVVGCNGTPLQPRGL